jgi:hypothetical protein
MLGFFGVWGEPIDSAQQAAAGSRKQEQHVDTTPFRFGAAAIRIGPSMRPLKRPVRFSCRKELADGRCTDRKTT